MNSSVGKPVGNYSLRLGEHTYSSDKQLINSQRERHLILEYSRVSIHRVFIHTKSNIYLCIKFYSVTSSYHITIFITK